MKISDRNAKKTESRSFPGSWDFGLLLPATYPSASPKTASGFWHSLFFPSGSDALWLKLAAPWRLGKTNGPWEPFPNRFWKGVNSVELQRSIWKLALKVIFSACPVCLSPKESVAPGTCSVALDFSQKHVSISIWWNLPLLMDSPAHREGWRCTHSHLGASQPQNRIRRALLLQKSTQLKRTSHGFENLDLASVNFKASAKRTRKYKGLFRILY